MVEETTAAVWPPVSLIGRTVSLKGPLTASTIALICAAVDYLHDSGADAITVDLRAAQPDLATRRPAMAVLSEHGGSEDQVAVRLLLPLRATT